MLTVNASQVVAETWGIDLPDISVIQAFVIAGTSDANREARDKLRGRHTKHLIVVGWEWYDKDLEEALGIFAYSYGRLSHVSRLQQAKLVYDYTGLYCGIREPDRRMSTGIAASVLALHAGAKPLVLEGFSLTRSGHAYSRKNLEREHASGDEMVLTALSRRRHRLFAANPQFAEEASLSLCPPTEAVPPADSVNPRRTNSRAHTQR